MEQFFKLVREQAEKNVGMDGEPMLSAEQMANITAIMVEQKNPIHYPPIEQDKIFKTIIKGFPPMCMN